MTREQAKSVIRMSVIVNAQHISSLNKADDIINKIFDEHEAQLKAKDEEIADLRSVIETLELQASMYCGLWEKTRKDK